MSELAKHENVKNKLLDMKIWKILETLHFGDIGAHQDFKKPEFFMPELLLKEQWLLTVGRWYPEGA